MNSMTKGEMFHIDFDLSLSFYFKDKNQYKPANCHMNVYERFYDLNHETIDSNDEKWRFVTGLLLIDYNGLKICYVHSWIEFEEKIIDVTAFANSDLGSFEKPPKKVLEKYKAIMSHYRYVAHSRLRSSKLTIDFNRIAFKYWFSQEMAMKAIEDYLQSIVKAVDEDKELKSRFCSALGYVFKNGNYAEEMDFEVKL